MLLAFGVDMLDQLELVFGGVGLGGFVLGQKLDGVGSHELDLFDAPARLDQAQGSSDLVLGAARHLNPHQQAGLRADRAAGDAGPSSVVGVDQHARRRRGEVLCQVDLGLDDFLVGGSRSWPLVFRALAAISIIELFWSRATIVSVPLGLLIRCKPRSLPGVRPLLMRTTTLQSLELSVVGIGRDLLQARSKGIAT